MVIPNQLARPFQLAVNQTSLSALLALAVASAGSSAAARAQDCATTPPAQCSGGNMITLPAQGTCFGACIPPSDLTLCNGACPSSTPTHDGTWSSVSATSCSAPVLSPDLTIPKFQVAPGECATLVQADITFHLIARSTVAVENRDSKPRTFSFHIDENLVLDGNAAVGVPPINMSVSFDQPTFTLAMADAPVCNNSGPDYQAFNFGPASNTRCIRITDPALLALFVGPAGSTISFPHCAADFYTLSGSGQNCNNADTFASVEVSVVYTKCSCVVNAVDDTDRVCVGTPASPTSVTINVLANDSTTCGSLVPPPTFVGAHPGFTLVGNNIVYTNTGTPSSGTVSCVYQICNNTTPTPCCATANVTVTLCSVNAADDTARVCAGTVAAPTSVSIPVLANDTTTCGSINGPPVFVGAHPGFTIVGNNIIYTNTGTPTSGTVSCVYSVCNNLTIPCCDTATVTVTVCSVTATNDTGRVCAGTVAAPTSVSVNVLANDSTSCGSLVGPPTFVGAHPGFTVVGNNIVYTNTGTPSSGTVSCTYQICNGESPPCCATATLTITVCGVTAVNDTGRVCAGTVAAPTSVTVDVLANDSTTCGSLVGPPTFVGAHPGFTLVGNNIVYTNTGTPTSGTVSCTYQICNGETPPCCATATLTITVCNVDAVNDTGRVCVGTVAAPTSVSINVLANDTSSCGSLVGPPAFVGAHPGFTLVGNNIVYTNTGTPSSGTVSCTYQICNGETPPCCDTATVTVTVCSVDAVDDTGRVCAGSVAAPTSLSIPVLANDTTTCGSLVGPPTFVGAHAGFTVSGSNIVYTNTGTPSSGTVSCTYQICNGESPPCCDTANVTVTICSVDAVNDVASVCAGGSVTIDVRANDTSSCGRLGCPTFVGAHPRFSLSGCNIVYDNAGGPGTGTETCTYQVCNGESPPCCDTATVTVSICTLDAHDDPVTICCGEIATVLPLANDVSTCGTLSCSQLELLPPVPPGFTIDGCTIKYDSNLGPCGTVVHATYRICSPGTFSCCDTADVIVTVNSKPDAVDDQVTYPSTATGPIIIHVLDNDSPGAGCAFPPCTGCTPGGPTNSTTCALRITTDGTFGTATINSDCTVTYTPGPTFSGTDHFCYELRNTCNCTATACVDITSCREINRRQCGSLLLFPEYDNTQSGLTLYTVTYGCCAYAGPPVLVEFRFINREDCHETNQTFTLTACDTLTFLTSTVNPTSARGYAYAYAKRAGAGPNNPSGEPIVFNHLIGQLLVINGIDALQYSMNAVSFRGLGNEGDDNDDDNDGIRDLNGPGSLTPEYEEVPDKIFIPRFIGQDPAGTDAIYDSSIVLIALSGGSQFITTIDITGWNDNETQFSSQYTFHCWDKPKLRDFAPFTLESFLDGQANAPDEIIGAPNKESGWLSLNGFIATSNLEQIDDPAIYAVLVEKIGVYSAADLPFEFCSQINGDLLPTSPLGDGPNPVAGDNQ